VVSLCVAEDTNGIGGSQRNCPTGGCPKRLIKTVCIGRNAIDRRSTNYSLKDVH
jgi:hypothetical protein